MATLITWQTRPPGIPSEDIAGVELGRISLGWDNKVTDTIVTETATRIYSDLGDPQAVNSARDDAWRAVLWSSLADAGLTLAWVPEGNGGSGAGSAEGFDVVGISGRFASPVPISETLLAGWLLARAGLQVPSGMLAVTPFRPRCTLTVTGDGRISGRARGIPFARDTGYVAVLAAGPKGPCVALLDAKSCRVGEGKTLAGDPMGDVTIDNAKFMALADAPKGLDQSKLMMMGAAIRAVETAGALQTILRLSTDYANERVAFGKPIGKFQAVQHNLARLAGEASAAMAAAGSAAEAIASINADPALFDEGIFLEIASARIRSAEAATEGAAIAHQVFGAIGFTKEHILHRFTMRLLSWRDDFGNESQWALDLGNRIAAKGADAFWPTVSAR